MECELWGFEVATSETGIQTFIPIFEVGTSGPCGSTTVIGGMIILLRIRWSSEVGGMHFGKFLVAKISYKHLHKNGASAQGIVLLEIKSHLEFAYRNQCSLKVLQFQVH